MFGAKKKEENTQEGKIKQYTSLLINQIEDLKSNAYIIYTHLKSSTLEIKLEKYNEEFLTFLTSLQTYVNFFSQNNQINKFKVIKTFVLSRPRRNFIISKQTDSINKTNFEKRIAELEQFKLNIENANSEDLENNE